MVPVVQADTDDLPGPGDRRPDPRSRAVQRGQRPGLQRGPDPLGATGRQKGAVDVVGDGGQVQYPAVLGQQCRALGARGSNAQQSHAGNPLRGKGAAERA